MNRLGDVQGALQCHQGRPLLVVFTDISITPTLYVVNTSPQRKHPHQPNPMDMGICIGRLALSSEFSDVRLIVGKDGEVIPAHKLILAARCEYFRKMFYGAQMKEAKENTCTFVHDDPQVFKTMLYHLYSRPLDDFPDPRHLVMCLLMAEKYGIDSFSEFCLSTLEDNISVFNACEILSLLEELYQDHSMVHGIVTKCYQFVLANLEDIIQEESHFYLSKDMFNKILQYPALACPEIDLYKGVVSWHSNQYGDFKTNRESLLQQLSMLDLKLIELNSLAECVHGGGVFSTNEMAELYRLRITLGQFESSARLERKFALMFHAGVEYNSRPSDVIAALVRAGVPIADSEVINFTNKCNLTYHALMQYSAVLVFSMETRTIGMCGDVLADYVDRGGCVVMCHALGCVGGRIMTDQYLPVKRVPPFEGEFKSYELGKIRDPAHPIVAGVSDLRVRCGPNFVWNCQPVEGTKVIAEWSDGTVLACERECGKGRVVFLNLYPVSTRVVIVGLEKDCQGHILLRNALLYAAYHPCKWL